MGEVDELMDNVHNPAHATLTDARHRASFRKSNVCLGIRRAGPAIVSDVLDQLDDRQAKVAVRQV